MSGKSNNVRSESQVDKAYHATEQVLFEIDRGVLIKLKDKGFRGSVIIPDSATSIGKYAFCRCGSLTSIEVSDNVTSIGEGAFGGCRRLRRIVFNGTQKQWEKIYPYSCDLDGIEVVFSA